MTLLKTGSIQQKIIHSRSVIMKIEKWIALSLALPTLTNCLYSSHSAVVQLTGSNFDELVVKHPVLQQLKF